MISLWFSFLDRAGFTMYRRWRIRSAIGVTGDYIIYGWAVATGIFIMGYVLAAWYRIRIAAHMMGL